MRSTAMPPNPRGTLAPALRSIQDVMRADIGVDGDAQRLAQLVWMLFLRAFDDQEQRRSENSKGYRHSVPRDLRWSTWSRNTDLDGDELLEFVQEKLFPSLQQLSARDNPQAALVRSALRDARNYMRSGSLLREVAVRLNECFDTWFSKDRQLLAEVYEHLLASLQNAGNAGEYYTPRPLIDFIVEQVNPKAGEKVLDYACGTGGFLVSALQHLQRGSRKARLKSLGGDIHGVEKKPLPHLLCVTNLLLHGVDSPETIVRGNLLDRPLSSIRSDERVDVIVTNPPFGGMEEDSVSFSFPEQFRSKDTADLFLVLAIHLLKEHGRAAIVVPDGILFGSGVKARIREFLLSTCNVHTVLRMPRGVFSPYAGIATNVLFFTKGQPTAETWYYDHPYPDGVKCYSKTRPIQRTEFEAEREWWGARKETEHAWAVQFAELASSGFNLDQRNPYRARVRSRHPDGLLRDHASCELAVGESKARIGSMLGKCLLDVNQKRRQALLEHLALLVSNPSRIDRFKHGLISIAMRGKLSPHLPGTGGSVVAEARTRLERSQAGKSRLGGDSGFFLPTHEIPPHWAWARADDLADVASGGTPKATDPRNFAVNGIPWLTPADLYRLSDKYISRGKRDLSEQGMASCSARLLPEGSVLFSSRAPIGYVAIAERPVSTNQGFKSLVPGIREMSEFLYYYLLYAREGIDARAPGTTFREVSGRIMRSIPVPVPPLDEQRSIALALDGVFQACGVLKDDLQALEDATAQVATGVLHYAVS